MNVELTEEKVLSSKTWTDLLLSIGLKQSQLETVKKRCQKMAINTSHLPEEHYLGRKRYSLKEIMIEDSDYSGSYLKTRLIKELGWENKCSSCELSEWLGKPIPLKISYKNGITKDKRVENIVLICRNCGTS